MSRKDSLSMAIPTLTPVSNVNTLRQAGQRFSDNDRRLMREVAWQAVDHGLLHHRPLSVQAADYPQQLQQPGACFVTIKIDQSLRGCIGTLHAIQPLIENVAHNAYAACFSDPRFPPLTPKERKDLQLRIAVLSPAEPMTIHSEKELLNSLITGKDGLILEAENHHATFLPAVWESLPEPEEFVQHLKQKAGLAKDYWSPDIRFKRYRSESF